MNEYKKAIACLSPWLILLLTVVGACSYSPERQHALYPSYMRQIRTVLLLPPEIGVVQRMQDGSTLAREDYSEDASRAVAAAVQQLFADKQLHVRIADKELTQHAQSEGIQALFRAVHRSIQLHTQGAQTFPSKLDVFDYQLGSVSGLLGESRSDALLLVLGHQTLAQNRPKMWLSMALVEPQGRVIWYNMTSEDDTSFDFHNPRAAHKLVRMLVTQFPGAVS